MELIATDYSTSGSVFVLKKRLKAELNTIFRKSCECHSLSNLDTVGMGHHQNIFNTLKRRENFGSPLWWLSLVECSGCNQFWMIGSEERINDEFILKRLSTTVSEKILNDDIWPEDFKKYSSLLLICRDQGKSVRFMDTVSRALVFTAIDLAQEKPGIRLQEISDLLQVELDQAEAIVEKAEQQAAILVTR